MKHCKKNIVLLITSRTMHNLKNKMKKASKKNKAVYYLPLSISKPCRLIMAVHPYDGISSATQGVST